MSISGIYMLTFKNCEKVYVGQSVDIKRRFKDHLRYLNMGEHSKKVQDAYKEFGEPELEILELCSDDQLNDRELFYINFWDSVNNGLNSTYSGQGGCNIFGEDRYNSIYSNEQIIQLVHEILANPTETLTDLAERLQIKLHTVFSVVYADSHKWLETAIPNSYKELKKLIGTRKASRIGCLNSKNAGENHGLSKYTNEQIESAFKMLIADFRTPRKIIANKCGISIHAVSNILIPGNYLWLKTKYPEEHNDLLKSYAEYKNRPRPKLVHPITGVIYEVTKISDFATEHGLSPSSVYNLLNYKANSAKGWRRVNY